MAVAAAFSALAGFGGGATFYWTGRNELYETIRAEQEARTTERLLTKRYEVLTVQELLADAQNELIGAPKDKQTQYLGRFLQTAVEGAARAAAAMHDSEDVEVRAIFIEYSEAEDSFTRGPMAGERPPIEFMATPADDFYRAAKRLFAISPESHVIGDANTVDPDITRLRLPGGADHYARIRVASGQQMYGILCIDTWGTRHLDRPDIEPVLAIAKILAGGIAAQGLQTQ